MIKKLQISGMTCGHCKMKVENTLNELEGIDSVEVDLIDGVAELNTENELDKGFISKTLSDAGYSLIAIED